MNRPPDILWIVTTQWRAQACGYAGDPNAHTPHLDALAARSIDYAQAVTPHPFGPFARAAMLTGVASPANGVANYFDPLPVLSAGEIEECRGAAPGTRRGRTVAHALRDRGYVTAFFGKWHLSRRDPAAPLVGEPHARIVVPPEARGGFEVWEGFESGFLLNDPWLHGTRLPGPRRFAGYQGDVLVERAAGWVAEEAGVGNASWFAVVSLEPPHPPYDAPAAGVSSRAAAEIVLASNVPRGGEVESRARVELAGYHAHIEATDRAIGRLIAEVDTGAGRTGRPPPIVVVTSVHGDMHGAHGAFRKGWPYEESVRVPLLVRPRPESAAPFAPGTRSPAAISLIDLPRMTLAWAAGGEVEITRAAAAISMPCIVALPHQCDRRWRGLRTPARKLVVGDDGAPWLFFDLAHDPGEQRNLAGEPAWAAEIARLRELIPPA
jgi:arylsulfatase A-like enzyme